MELKSEESIIAYLKTLPDDTIIRYYLDVEYSPFPVLLLREYQRRFKEKSKNEILKKLKVQANLARNKTKELGILAKKRARIDEISKQKSQEMIKQATNKGYKVSDSLLKKGAKFSVKIRKDVSKGVKKTKSIKTSSKDQLILLEKLGKLRKEGIITEKEFREKKRKILSKI